MAWTAPRTWVHNEVVTASMMNAHVRDNELVLKTTRDAAGRVSALSSSTLGNLSGTNLTGVAFLAAGNAYTDGRHRYLDAARLIIPVGTDKWTGTKGVDAKGWWVEGEELHHIDQNLTTEWKYLGELVNTGGAPRPGSVWVEGEYLHYIAEGSGNERRCQSAGAVGAHADVNAIAGSSWVETYVHWIREGGQEERPGHADVAHSDGTVHNDTHSDVAHSDVPHQDIGHADSHGDEAHSDATGHGDIHVDHNDVGHADNHGDHTDGHGDAAHNDSHTDTPHSDALHSDSHTDTHDDHSDHGDVVAQNQPTVVV